MTGGDRFPTTQWSLVLIAGEGFGEESRQALSTLCGAYWYPLYAFVRREGYSHEEAQDLTQAFFTKLLDKKYLKDCDRDRGRFRTFLLAALKHFLSNQRDWDRAQKRGGGAPTLSLDILMESGESRYRLEPHSALTPEKSFERQWALAVLDRVFSRLKVEMAGAGKAEYFEKTKPLLIGADDRIPYSELAGQLGMTEASLKVAIHRLRRRFRDILRDEISQTVMQAGEIQEEIRYLIATLV
jgi:RNA polymerase sigma factor (sigma-70 family)